MRRVSVALPVVLLVLGSPRPSRADQQATAHVARSARLVRVRLVSDWAFFQLNRVWCRRTTRRVFSHGELIAHPAELADSLHLLLYRGENREDRGNHAVPFELDILHDGRRHQWVVRQLWSIFSLDFRDFDPELLRNDLQPFFAPTTAAWATSAARENIHAAVPTKITSSDGSSWVSVVRSIPDDSQTASTPPEILTRLPFRRLLRFGLVQDTDAGTAAEAIIERTIGVPLGEVVAPP
jgi:hypothetical protein